MAVGVLLFGTQAPPPALAAEGEAPQTSYCYPARPDDAAGGPVCISLASYHEDTCRALERYAADWNLPNGFFARLIWQESRFDPNAVSPAGAMGIAQFMPGTARLRKLANAFNPAEALARSAEYLRFLADKFGNLGLAAAAYNSGEGRVSALTAGGVYMPSETEQYVQIITGHSITQWLSEPPGDVDFRLQADKAFHEACVELARTRTINRFETEPGEWRPWGVQLAANFSPEIAMQTYKRVQGRFPKLIGDEKPMMVAERNPRFGTRLRHHARIGRDTREEAMALCNKIQAAGGACLVMRN